MKKSEVVILAPRVPNREFSHLLLGLAIAGSSSNGGANVGQAEVSHFGALLVQQDVQALDIAVDDTTLMEVFQSLRRR